MIHAPRRMSRSRVERRHSPSRSHGEHHDSNLRGSKADLRDSKMDLFDPDRKTGRRKNILYSNVLHRALQIIFLPTLHGQLRVQDSLL